MRLLVTALMAASALSILALVWLTYRGVLLRGEQDRVAETLKTAALFIRDRHDGQTDRRSDEIKDQLAALEQVLDMFMASLKEKARAAGDPASQLEARRQALRAAAEASARTGLNVFVFDRDYTGLAHADTTLVGGSWRGLKGLVGQGALEFLRRIVDRDGQDTTVLWWPGGESGAPRKHLAHVASFPAWGWYVGVSVDYGRLDTRFQQDLGRMLRAVADSLSRVRLGRTGRIFIMDDRSVSFLLTPPGADREILAAHADEIGAPSGNGGEPVRYVWPGPGGGRTAFVLYLPELGWNLGLIMETSELSAPVVILAKRLLLAIAGVFLAGLALAWLFTRRITGPILELARSAGSISPTEGAGPEEISRLRSLAAAHTGEVAVLASAWADTLAALDAGMADIKKASRDREETARELTASKAELEGLNRDLESRVVARTAALEAAFELLSNSEARYRGLFMNSPVPFLEVDLSALAAFLRSPEAAQPGGLAQLFENRPGLARGWTRLLAVRSANPAALAVTGAARQAELRENLDRIIPANSLAQAMDLFAAFEGGAAAYGYETRFTAFDGRTRHCVVGLRPLPGHEEALGRVLISVQDVTPLKESEERLRAANEQAQAASRAKSEFLANMSHEIRTPISAILGLAELSQRQNDPAKTAVHLNMIAESARNLLGIIGDVLDLSRVEAGKLTLDLKAFDPAQAVKRAVEPFRGALAAKGLELALDLPESLPGSLTGDPIRLGQVLTNLIGNAVKFTGQGTVTVSATVSETGEDHAQLLFCVRDTGVGIPAALAEAIFESFRQADSSFSKTYQGAGLGLAVCRELTALMGGRIWVESEAGRGSAFSFTARFGLPAPALAPDPSGNRALPDALAALPASQGDLARISSPVGLALPGSRQGVAAAPSPGGVARARQKLDILVTEDNPVNRHVFTEFLTSIGHAVSIARDGLEALELMTTRGFDLVFMDIQMPRLDGLTAVRRLRSGECGPQAARTPVVALTAYAMSGDRERFLAAGMTGYLSKPVSLDAIEAAVALHALAPGDSPEDSPGATPDASPDASPVDAADARPEDEPEATSCTGVGQNAGREALMPLMEEFIAYIRERLAQAEAHLAAGELDLAAKAGHDVKGTSMAFGVGTVNALGARLEQAARAGDAEAAAGAVRELYGVLSELCEKPPASPRSMA